MRRCGRILRRSLEFVELHLAPADHKPPLETRSRLSVLQVEAKFREHGRDVFEQNARRRPGGQEPVFDPVDRQFRTAIAVAYAPFASPVYALPLKAAGAAVDKREVFSSSPHALYERWRSFWGTGRNL